jgi:hypothetical protein
MKYTLYARLFTGSLFGGMVILLEVPVIIYTCIHAGSSVLANERCPMTAEQVLRK